MIFKHKWLDGDKKKFLRRRTFFVVCCGILVYAVNVFIRKNIRLTTNQDTPINTNPIAACSKILNHFLYLVSSPAAVIIWNPPHSKMISAISANIPKIRLTHVVIDVINLPSAILVEPTTCGLKVVSCPSNHTPCTTVHKEKRLIAQTIHANV